ncbi:MAG: hypothetical protein AAGC78_05430 [Cellvibrio sp.]|uniref:hypothetical protein n=1 Tax=Cellvibrio sp. TaxID=1965322 RepID=UPI0031B0192D
MANTNKTKAEILQELESIKGLLLEEDDIPILQDMEDEDEILDEEFDSEPPILFSRHESVLPGQGSLFDELNPLKIPTISAERITPEGHTPAVTSIAQQLQQTISAAQDEHVNTPSSPDTKKPGFVSHLTNNSHVATHQPQRNLAKASGENPFLPQHIRERLHGNNPPPLFEYETAKKIISSTKNIANKTNRPRQYLVEAVMLSMMPQLERELRNHLFAMSVEDLEKLLNEDED